MSKSLLVNPVDESNKVLYQEKGSPNYLFNFLTTFSNSLPKRVDVFFDALL
jgi:hypothetical protein